MGRLRNETISGAKWQLLQKLTLEPLQLLYAMLLARLVTPTDMGILGLTAIFFALAGALSEAGFSSALVRKQNRTAADCDTVFWINVSISTVLGLGLAAAAPWFADFYQQPELLWLTRASSVVLFLNSLASMHGTLFTCRRDFKTPALIQFSTTLIGMPVCLITAWMGWGVWALMTQQLTVAFCTFIIYWHCSPWRPSFNFSLSSFRELFAFGGNLCVSSILFTLYNNARTFIIGKFYSAAMLGYYSRGAHLSEMVPLTVNRIINNIAYPILSTVQDDTERLCSAFRKYIQISTVCIAWAGMFACAMAEPLVTVVYGDQWGPCVPYVRLVAIYMSMMHIGTLNNTLLKVKGRSDLFLRLDLLKKAISLAALFLSATISVTAICWALIICSQLDILITGSVAGRLIGLGWFRQQCDYLPYVLVAALCFLPGYLIACYTALPALCLLVLSAAISIVLYAGILRLLKDPAYCEIVTGLSLSPHVQSRPVLAACVKWLSPAERRP